MRILSIGIVRASDDSCNNAGRDTCAIAPPARERNFGGIDVATLARYASRAARSLAIDSRSAGPDPT